MRTLTYTGSSLGSYSMRGSGVLLIGLGLLLVWMPELLAFVVAGFFIFSGVSLLILSLKIRHLEKAVRRQQPFEV